MKEIISSILIVGVGNSLRGDDGTGIYAAEKLRSFDIPNVKVEVITSELLKLLDLWKKDDNVIIIDALVSKSKPGRIRIFKPTEETLPVDSFRNMSTHSIDLPQVLELARIYESLPKSIKIYGIEGENFDLGNDKICDTVKKAADELVREISSEIANPQGI